VDNVSKFYEVLAKDEQMQERAKNVNIQNTADEAAALSAFVAFAAKEGFSLTTDEVKDYLAAKSKGELNDEQLEAVAGGQSSCGIVGTLSLGCNCVIVGTGQGGSFCFIYGE